MNKAKEKRQFGGHAPLKFARVGTLPETQGVTDEVTSRVVTGYGAGAHATMGGGIGQGIWNGPKCRRS